MRDIDSGLHSSSRREEDYCTLREKKTTVQYCMPAGPTRESAGPQGGEEGVGRKTTVLQEKTTEKHSIAYLPVPLERVQDPRGGKEELAGTGVSQKDTVTAVLTNSGVPLLITLSTGYGER